VADVMGVGEAKKRFSELMSHVTYKGERFLIQRHGKPMVAMVPAQDLELLEQSATQKRGLIAAVGAWAEHDDIDQMVEEIYRLRDADQDRSVHLEE